MRSSMLLHADIILRPEKNFKQIIHFCTHQKNVHTDVQPEHQQEDRSQTAI